ncbi:MAG TPA: PadR family transcriptional regulator [Gemmatimonadales bacterium]|nr:PadR family transcriptional regulator [Gemmatimonadales bacterium]
MSELPRPASLHPRVFAILLALADGPRHGYRLMQELQEDPTERWLLGPATLYRTLKEMQRDGLITSTEGPDEESGGPPRRYYRLTASGHRAGAAEAARMAALVRRWEQATIPATG